MHQQTRYRKAGDRLKRIAVIGAGTMGHGIAQVAAMAGYETYLTDSDPIQLERAMARIDGNLTGGVKRGKVTEAQATEARRRIHTEVETSDAVKGADVVIEAIIEELSTKRELFSKLDEMVKADTILASNTSSLSIKRIADTTKAPSRVIGMHFFNPVHIMKLVEIVRHDNADPSVVERAREIAVQMGKEPIVVKDTPGFASSRLGLVLGLEAMRMIEQGVAGPDDIDKAMELGYGHPMGPLKVGDLVGLDVRLAIAEYLHAELKEAQYAPPSILKAKVAAGELGKKTGKGFYEWPTEKQS